MTSTQTGIVHWYKLHIPFEQSGIIDRMFIYFDVLPNTGHEINWNIKKYPIEYGLFLDKGQMPKL